MLYNTWHYETLEIMELLYYQAAVNSDARTVIKQPLSPQCFNAVCFVNSCYSLVNINSLLEILSTKSGHVFLPSIPPNSHSAVPSQS